ncbi:MAG TPA: hypothetical protein VIV57_07835 [Anaeromyxobacter sp.]
MAHTPVPSIVVVPPGSSTLARVSAALLAVALSGAPRVLALHAPLEGHHCECKSGGQHHLECAACRRAALAARSTDAKLPECHRAAARKALAKGEPAGGAPNAPCLERACGGSGQPALTAGGTEPYLLPAAKAPAFAPRTERTPAPSDGALERPLAPETPPPKPA